MCCRSPTSRDVPSRAQLPSCATWTSATRTESKWTSSCARARSMDAWAAVGVQRRLPWRLTSGSCGTGCSYGARDPYPCPWCDGCCARGPGPFCCGGGASLTNSSWWRGGVELLVGVTVGRVAGQASAGAITSAAMGNVDWALQAGTLRGCAYQESSSPSIYTNQGRVR
jgi:hypothetical protein